MRRKLHGCAARALYRLFHRTGYVNAGGHSRRLGGTYAVENAVSRECSK